MMQGLQGFDKFIPGYSQSIIQYQYLRGEKLEPSFEKTGVIENEKNVWMHPPRSMLFRILEINPFPFVMHTGVRKWRWDLKIGDNWADERWKSWTGTVENRMTYRDKGYRIIESPLGNLRCRKITAEGKLPWGKTTLTSWYHADYGFVKLVYTNIDGSKMVINLERVI